MPWPARSAVDRTTHLVGAYGRLGIKCRLSRPTGELRRQRRRYVDVRRLDGRQIGRRRRSQAPKRLVSATNSVINRSYHSHVDDVPTGSAEEKPTRMCGEKPCVTA